MHIPVIDDVKGASRFQVVSALMFLAGLGIVLNLFRPVENLVKRTTGRALW